MYAPRIHTHQNGLTPAALADHRPRSGDGPLAEEALYGRASHAARQPEAALMCAILQDAVESFQEQFVSTATRRAKRLSEEAEQWLFSDDSHWLFSFLSICDALDLCPQYIRQGLKCWHERSPQLRKQPANDHRKLSNPTPMLTLISSSGRRDRAGRAPVSRVFFNRAQF